MKKLLSLLFILAVSGTSQAKDKETLVFDEIFSGGLERIDYGKGFKIVGFARNLKDLEDIQFSSRYLGRLYLDTTSHVPESSRKFVLHAVTQCDKQILIVKNNPKKWDLIIKYKRLRQGPITSLVELYCQAVNESTMKKVIEENGLATFINSISN